MQTPTISFRVYRGALRGRLRSRVEIVADEIDTAFEVDSINDNSHLITVPEFADRPAGECLGAHVPNAGAGRDAAEAGIGNHRDMLAPRKMLEGGCHLISFFHPGDH